MKINLRFLVVSILILALLAPAFSASAKVNKFTFENVIFEDGTAGVIEAGTKETGSGSVYTVCGYFTTGYAEYLGQFEEDTFFSEDPEAVEQFCLSNYANRTLP